MGAPSVAGKNLTKDRATITATCGDAATVIGAMGSLIKKRRKRMRKKKHKKMLKRTRFQRRAKGK
jgi:hypothetical protein